MKNNQNNIFSRSIFEAAGIKLGTSQTWATYADHNADKKGSLTSCRLLVLLDSCLVDDDLVAVVQDVDGVVAHDELGRLLLLEQQRRRRVFVTLGGSSFLLLGVDLFIFNKKLVQTSIPCIPGKRRYHCKRWGVARFKLTFQWPPHLLWAWHNQSKITFRPNLT